MKYFYLGLFGLVGVYGRYLIGVLSSVFLAGLFPWHTLGINLIGSFAMGFIYSISIAKISLNEDLRIGLMTGLLGGFTTFSAFSLETVMLLTKNEILSAGLYILASVIGGFTATFLGLLLGKV